MKRLTIVALGLTAMLAAGAADRASAQQICCVPAPPPGSMRGPIAAPPPPQGLLGGGMRGYVGIEYSKARLEPGTPSPRVETWTGEGYISTGAGSLGLQADLKAARFSGPGGDDWVTSPTLHLYRRNPFGLIGGFAGWSHTRGADLLGLGVEGQAYMSGATLYGSLGVGRVNDVIDSNLTAARIEGRYFLTENLRLDAQLGYVRQTARPATPTGNRTRTEAFMKGVGAEYQFGAVPVSLRASYQRVDAGNSPIGADTIRLGVRWSFYGDTLIERDRLGPSLSNVTDLFLSN